jgi:transcriptional regulator with XRE-family HTH domain
VPLVEEARVVIKDAITRKKLTLNEVARRSGYSRGHLSRFLQGQASDIKLDSLERLGAACGMRLGIRAYGATKLLADVRQQMVPCGEKGYIDQELVPGRPERIRLVCLAAKGHPDGKHQWRKQAEL